MAQRLATLPLLIILMGISALLMVLPAAYALMVGDYAASRTFFFGGVTSLALTTAIALAISNRRLGHDRLLQLLGAYAVLPVLMALPFHQTLNGVPFLDAWFEMVSSLTTTGATLYPPADLPATLHLWRGIVGWSGGLLILVLATTILAPLNLGGVEVFSDRPRGSPHRTLQKPGATTQFLRAARSVLPAYAGLTAVLWLLLVIAGDAAFAALCRAMATLSTSAILPVGATEPATSGRVGEYVVLLFLLVATTRRSLPGAVPLPGHRGRFDDPELKTALVIVALVTGLFILRSLFVSFNWDTANEVPRLLNAAWGSAFTALSFLTTTGFVSQDWPAAKLWSGLEAPGLILAGLAMIGGGIATTAGGVKLLRIYALLRHGERELGRQVHPSSIGGSGQAARRLRRAGAHLAWIFLILFAVTIFVIAALLALCGLSFEQSLVFSISALTTTGPLATHWGGANLDYTQLAGSGKLVLMLAMLLGRIETLVALAMLSMRSWGRA